MIIWDFIAFYDFSSIVFYELSPSIYSKTLLFLQACDAKAHKLQVFLKEAMQQRRIRLLCCWRGAHCGPIWTLKKIKTFLIYKIVWMLLLKTFIFNGFGSTNHLFRPFKNKNKKPTKWDTGLRNKLMKYKDCGRVFEKSINWSFRFLVFCIWICDLGSVS